MATEERKDTTPASERLANDERRVAVGPLVAIALISAATGIAVGLVIDWFPLQASEQAPPIDTLYDVLIVASVPMFVLVESVVLYSVWKFRMRPGEEDMDGPPIHGNTKLEVIWTAIPAILMLGLCTYAYVVLRDIEEAPARATDELNVRVVGEQFTWTFFYPPAEPGGREIASSRLYLPIDRPVKFKVQSKDVIHDFWVPAFRMKIDAVPGLDTSYRVTPNRIGRYPVVCAELCGLGHSVMRQTAAVVPPAEFDKWLAEQAAGKAGGEGGAKPGEVDGKTLFTSVEPSCGSCHVLADAGTDGTIGPDLDKSLAGKDEAYIREAIVNPDATIADGFSPGIMPPNYEQTLDPAEIDALVEYLVEATEG